MGCNNSTAANAAPPASNPAPKPQASRPTSVSTPTTPVNNSSKEQRVRPPGATIQQFYKLGEVLGEGGYSVVRLGTSLEDGRKVAVKVVTRANLAKEDEDSLRSEVQILTSINHPNIVKAFEFFEEEKYFYVILEYLDGGELFDRIVKKTFYNEKEARDLVQTLLLALKYLHHKNIVHRDLKPENLLMATQNDDANVKLADFGFAVIAEGNTVTSQCGTPGYIAPEILENKSYGKPVDMWSFGVILYILLGGYPPFHDDNQRALFRKIVKGEYEFHPEYWGTVSDEAKDLIRGLLTLDMSKRLTVDQALAHPWLNRSAKELEARNLDSNLAALRKYQATRKLKAGVKAIMAVNRMKNLMGGLKEAAAIVNAENSDAPADPTRI
mmetsp:Transcript_7741/g.8449  ORF Transcript_7741/g.8449 Transcript_7741/m.8449 type:complete len:383 (-) Transcript_7741:100-1248(-)|eukprot:CAMPEP_0173153984 /NCGR_PEP_ID=MMETSP1105-20130129/13205_1 /TAXON_ID=2985 /ORGANISM="Ochromonas sp., Strain BG-1" /LENGTH=382 /DNA_ID=CAMNT_0014070063 /DNA_START=1204 /DNA_END=2352 /DNA_ORIENTATION=+